MLTDTRFYLGLAFGAALVLFVVPMIRGAMAGKAGG
jgi:hypothetical protein